MSNDFCCASKHFSQSYYISRILDTIYIQGVLEFFEQKKTNVPYNFISILNSIKAFPKVFSLKVT